MSVSATAQPAHTTPAFQRRGLSLRLRLVLLILAIAVPVFLVIALAMHTEARRLLLEYADTQIAASNSALKNNVATWLDLNTKALKATGFFADDDQHGCGAAKALFTSDGVGLPRYVFGEHHRPDRHSMWRAVTLKTWPTTATARGSPPRAMAHRWRFKRKSARPPADPLSWPPRPSADRGRLWALPCSRST